MEEIAARTVRVATLRARQGLGGLGVRPTVPVMGEAVPVMGEAVPLMGDARLQLLGGFELAIGQRPVPIPLGSRRLLAFLALRGRAVTRSQVAGSLWAEIPEERAMASLRSALWSARRACPWLVACQADLLSLDPRLVVDVREVYRQAHDLVDQPASSEVAADLDAAAIAGLAGSGELLLEWDDDWVLGPRERLRQVRLHALEALSGRLAAAGRFGRAVEVALAAVEADPLRESARRALIRVHLAEGNLSEAIAQYRAYRSLLLEELGMEPSRQLVELAETLAAG